MRAFVVLLYAVALFELILAVGLAATGPVAAGLPLLVAAAVTGALARVVWRDYERRGDDHWLYS